MSMSKLLRKVMFYTAPTPVGSLFFMITKPIFKNDKTSRLGDLWWYGYLYNFACNMNLKNIAKKNKGYRAIRRLMPDYDNFGSYNTVFHIDCVAHIVYELSQGYIPVIDDSYHVWEQLFKQPEIISNAEVPPMESIPSSDEYSPLHTPMMLPECKPVRKLWSKLLWEFSQLKDAEMQYIQNEVDSIIGNQRVLGVVCRGTDYIGTGMPPQPKVEDLIAKAKEWMEEFGYEKVYLATEAESIYQEFHEAFGDRLLVNKRKYYDKVMEEKDIKWISMVHFDRENDNYWKGLEYLSSMYIVANCKALLGGYCGASNMALLLNNEKYERFIVYDFR